MRGAPRRLPVGIGLMAVFALLRLLAIGISFGTVALALARGRW